MSLFTKPINEIAIDDVEVFCKQDVGEGVRLEYKNDFSGKNANRQIAKEIAAFANTYGGLLLIGVDEEDRKPKLPILGIDFSDGLEEKIVSIALKGINPPVFPEIQICKLKGNPKKVVIVIRVQESDETPHRVEQDTKVYIRVASQSEPQLARFEEIEWLINRREKAIANRERLLRRAYQRFAEKYKENKPGVKLACRGMSIIPLFPHGELTKYSNLPTISSDTAVRFPSGEFPENLHNGVSIQESIVFSSAEKWNGFPWIIHTEINSFGLVFRKESICETSANGEYVIEAPRTLEMVYVFLSFANKFYQEIGFFGGALFRLFFENIKGRDMILYVDPGTRRFKNEFDGAVNIDRKVSTAHLSEHFDEIVLDLYKEFLWSFGAKSFALHEDILKEHIDKTKWRLGLRGK